MITKSVNSKHMREQKFGIYKIPWKIIDIWFKDINSITELSNTLDILTHNASFNICLKMSKKGTVCTKQDNITCDKCILCSRDHMNNNRILFLEAYFKNKSRFFNDDYEVY